MTVLVDQTQPADGIPSFAKKFVGDEIQIVQREEWRERDVLHAARRDPRQAGRPERLHRPRRRRRRAPWRPSSGDIKVKIPLIGGKLEGLIGELLSLRAAGRGARGPGLAGRDALDRSVGVPGRASRLLLGDVPPPDDVHDDEEHHERAERDQAHEQLLDGVQRAEVQRER